LREHYKTRSEIETIVRGFESCTTGKDEFTHRSHLTVAVWYLRDSTFAEAAEKLRAGLRRFLDHHGVGREKYNETMTIFWMTMIGNCLKGLDPQLTLVVVTNAVVAMLGDPRLILHYYSEERLRSEAAKQAWIEPDLRSISE
jgi:hypothetical protein